MTGISRYQSLKFQYNFQTGRGAYLLACNDDTDFQYYIAALEDQTNIMRKRLHPFALHLIFLFKSVLAQSRELEEMLRRVLAHEKRLLFSSQEVTPEAANVTKGKLQALHSLFGDLLIRSNNNKRNISIAKCLINDMERLEKLGKTVPDAHAIDPRCHQRIVGKCNQNPKNIKSFSAYVAP